MDKYKLHSLVIIASTTFMLLLIAILTYVIDPFFHYHAPNKNFHYLIYMQRYQNDGILRNFDYNAIITGTSMTENFKTSEFDQLFGVKSVKTSFSGGSYKEINDNINRAIQYNPHIQYILRALDSELFFSDKDHMPYIAYPTYLTDDKYSNDIKYLLNKTIFLENVIPVLQKYEPNKGTVTSFDIAYNWNSAYTFGKQSVLSTTSRISISEEIKELTDKEITSFQENINQNIVSTIKNNPNIKFYYFITPYSICYWDYLYRDKALEKHLYGEKMIIESIINYENIYLFSFNDDFELVTNLDNYKDIAHYGENVNSLILNHMVQNNHRLTKDNYQDYLKKIYDYYSTYDYDSIYN